MRRVPSFHRSVWTAAALLAFVEGVGAEQVSVRPRSIDFGIVPAGLRVESKITLVNNAEEAILVGLSVGEPFSLPVGSLTIEKGGEREIAIAFAADMPGIYGSEIAVEVESFSTPTDSWHRSRRP